MGLRPARIYKEFKRPYTRTAVKAHKKAYIKGVPGKKLNTFIMGNQKGNFENTLYLVTERSVQIRHNALEACRVAANAYVRKHIDEKEYFIKVRVYPHHILREHAQAAIAQADRFFQGMSHPFGKPNSSAARVKTGQPIISISVNNANLPLAKEAMRRAGDKLGVGNKVITKI